MTIIDIQTKNGSEAEQKTVGLLQGLLRKYDLSAYFFTHEVIVASGVIPHSHPVLTLNTRHNANIDRLLSTFLHEQIHWFATQNESKVRRAIEELKTKYPNIPKAPPEGSSDEFSSYLHLIINWLELQADKKFLGHERAYELISQSDVYPGIYKIVLNEESSLEAILGRYSLVI
jgi:hypothetical protein